MMSYEQDKAKAEAKAQKIGEALIGKKIVQVEIPVSYPGHFESIRLVLEDGTKLDVSEGAFSGCPECDPEGIGCGVGVEISKA